MPAARRFRPLGYRFRSAAGIRVTTADLDPDEAERLADAIAGLAGAPAETYAG